MDGNSQGILDIDWGERWIVERRARVADDSPEYWDKRAPKFGTKRGMSPYQLAFVEKLALEPGDTVFDMGCGNGAIAIPLAKAAHEVIARDFSAGMLAALAAEMEAQGISGIDYARMNWEDDWEANGISDGMVDVAFASRSVITADLRASLAKLSRVARKRACVTVATASSPHTSVEVLRSLGATEVRSAVALYTFAILVQLGFNPQVSYIESSRYDSYEDYDDALRAMTRMLGAAERHVPAWDLETMRRNLPGWLEDHLIPNESAGKVNSHDEVEGPLRLDIESVVRWAFIGWEV